MIRVIIASLVVFFAGAFAAFGQEDHPGKAAYQRCAACHLPDGAGIPGAFPALREDILQLAVTEKGRDYLTYVVRKGVAGSLETGGTTYYSVMPAVAADLEDEQVAELLNYLVTQVAPGEGNAETEAPNFVPFVSEEIAARSNAVLDAHSQQNILELRAEAMVAPIDKPPKEDE